MPDPNQTTIVGDPEMLERLRVWAEPLYRGPIHRDGPGGLIELQKLIEDASAAVGVIPQYRVPNA